LNSQLKNAAFVDLPTPTQRNSQNPIRLVAVHYPAADEIKGEVNLKIPAPLQDALSLPESPTQ
jgi:hypothetical protein